MKAAVVWEAGGPFVVQQVGRRPVMPGEVVVRVRAAGVCQTDISLAQGAFGQTTPVVLGHEGAGEVVEVGEGVARWALGDRVLLTWVPPCGHCYHCVRGETYICAGRKRSSERAVAGGIATADLVAEGVSVQQGMGTATFAEEAVVPAHGLVAIPADLPFEYAALLGCAVPTGLGAALNSAVVRPGETVVVIGCGAVGLSALQGAVIAGASAVVGVDPRESRRSAALGLGATGAVDPAGVLPPGPGFDVAIDAVGHPTTIRNAWESVRRGGRVIVVGASKSDDRVSFSAQELFHDEKTLRGSFYGSSDMSREVPLMVDLWRSGRLNLDRMVEGVVPIDQINDVVRRQLEGDVVRIVVTP